MFSLLKFYIQYRTFFETYLVIDFLSLTLRYIAPQVIKNLNIKTLFIFYYYFYFMYFFILLVDSTHRSSKDFSELDLSWLFHIKVKYEQYLRAMLLVTCYEIWFYLGRHYLFRNLKSRWGRNEVSAQLWSSQRERTPYFVCNYDDMRATRCSWNVSTHTLVTHATTERDGQKSSAHLLR